MRWSNLWQLKDGWQIENHTMLEVKMYHEKTGLAKTVKLPALVVVLIDLAEKKARAEVRREIRQALGLDD